MAMFRAEEAWNGKFEGINVSNEEWEMKIYNLSYL